VTQPTQRRQGPQPLVEAVCDEWYGHPVLRFAQASGL
jgi:hypothetical protein